MLKDDRMMSMMTFLVVMLALGTLINRTDLFDRLLGGEKVALELVRDDAVVQANQISSIDVLANDRGVEAADAGRLEIAEQPKCGRAFTRDGAIQYLAAQRCVGSQSFRYTIAGRANGQTGEVIAVVRLGQPTTEEPRSGNPAGTGGARTGGQGQATPPPAPEGPAAQAPAGDATSRPVPGGSALPVPGQLAGPDGQTVTEVMRNGVPGGDSDAGAGSPGDGRSEPPPGDAPVPVPATVPAVPAGHATAAAGSAGGAETGPSDADSDPGADGESDPAPGGGPAAQPQPSLAVAPAAAQGDAGGSAVPAQRQPAQPCEILPTLTLDPEPGGVTEVIVDAPCQAGTVAELAYDGLRFGIALDSAGVGSVRAFGLQEAAEALVRFADRSETGFLITFDDLDRIERVVLLWEAPVSLELHAFEFGARPTDPGHVGPGRARSFDEARRRGGGFLLHYAPVDGIGQNLQVYSYWRGRRGRPGVVRLEVDFADRTGPERPGTCGEGDNAAPEFTVLRSIGGRIGRPSRAQLAPLDCTSVAALPERFIGDAVDDLIVMQR